MHDLTFGAAIGNIFGFFLGLFCALVIWMNFVIASIKQINDTKTKKGE